jgi:hypothetical protein
MAAQLLLGLVCIGFVVVGFLATWVMFFRLSCRLCDLESPTVTRTLGIVIVTFVAGLIAESMLAASVRFVYQQSKLPLWESGVTAFFLGLPVDMVVNAAIHAGMMRIAMGKGIEVWFVQRIMLLAVFVPIAFLMGLIFFLTK